MFHYKDIDEQFSQFTPKQLKSKKEFNIDKMVADSSERRGKKDLRHLFSFLARMAKLCPQEPMRKRCADHLSDLKDFVDSQGENIQSSWLVPTRFEERPIIVDWTQEIWQRIFRNNMGRVTGLHLCLSTHIPFLQNYFDTMEVLMKETLVRNYGEQMVQLTELHFLLKLILMLMDMETELVDTLVIS